PYAGLGHVSESALIMPVPEASVNEKNRAIPWENDIRSSWKVAPMQSKTITHPMKGSPNGQLGRCIPRTDPRHHSASLLGGDNVHRSRSQLLFPVIQLRSTDLSANSVIEN